MYKIYSTAQVCCLATPQELLPNLTGTITAPVVPYLHKKIFSNYLGRTEYPQVTFFADDLEKMWETYKKQFIYLEAAGGLVFNSSRNLLVIFRRGFWDLPKGKVDPGETLQETAMREVMEETGLLTEILNDLPPTYHTYPFKTGTALKKSVWFEMQWKEGQVKLQAEEDIDDHAWINPQEFLEKYHPIYPSIREAVSAYLSRMPA
ncbi:MAG: NUDIX hydrolase [Saprospiraceae bacterium]|nr:NUDIX hydrolase [Saprospiraceae bacterium]HPG06205.1 NUDIX hydrolase [Saprospiraceae bacterium]